MLGGPTQTNKTMFGSLQLAADTRSDRDEVSPRVMSYKAPIAGSDVLQRRQPLHAETQPLNVFNRVFGGALPTGTDPARILAQKLSVCDFMKRDIARMQTLIPATEKDRLATHLFGVQQLEASLRQTYGMMRPHGHLHEAGDAADVREHQQRADDLVDRVHDRVGRRLLRVRLAQQPPPPGPRAQSAPADQDGVRVRPGSRRDVHVVLRDELGRVSGTFQGASIRGNPQSAPHHPPSHSDPAGGHRDARLAEPDQQFYSAATAQILQEFATTPDVDSTTANPTTLIDNTIVVYVTEVARAWDHNQQNMPLIIFGGKNTRVRGGTYLKVRAGRWPRRRAALQSTGRSTTCGWRCCRSSASTAPFCRARAARCMSTGSTARDLFLGPGAAFPVV